MPTEETRLHFHFDKKIHFSSKSYLWWPMKAVQKYSLQNKNVCYSTYNVYVSTKISVYSGDNFFQLKRTSSTKVLFQHKYVV